MSDDVLAQASRALCEQASTPAEYAWRTRARVLARASRGKRRNRLAVLLVPVVAVLGASSALASTHGGLSEMWNRVARLLVRDVPDDRGTGAPRESFVVRPPHTVEAALPARAAPIATAPSIPELPVEALLPAIQGPVVAAPSARKRADEACDAKRAEIRPQEGAEDEDAARLYAEAHRAHFVDRDPEAALRAWDAYLAAAANGPLAPEARYNRALTLVRLDRLAEARAALAPFASGAYGGYRAQEARAILDALSRR
jgi:hypothetical protein